MAKSERGFELGEGISASKTCMYAACISHNTIPELHCCEILSHRLPDSYLSIKGIGSRLKFQTQDESENLKERS